MKVLRILCLLPAAIVLIFSCQNDSPVIEDAITFQQWTLKTRSSVIRDHSEWMFFRSEHFPSSVESLQKLLTRGEQMTPLENPGDYTGEKPVTWFIHVDDALPELFSGCSIKEDSLIKDSQAVSLNGKYYVALIQPENSEIHHELILAGKNADPDHLSDFINKPVFFEEKTFLYERGSVTLFDNGEESGELQGYPDFPESSVNWEWIEKIRNSDTPRIIAEAFESFITSNHMPLIIDSLVTFFWFEPAEEHGVHLLSDISGWKSESGNQMINIPGTHIHFYQEVLHPEARVEYLFQAENDAIRDYLNPFYTGNGHFSHSVVTMPMRKEDPVITRDPLVFQTQMDDFINENGKRIHVILPPAYSQTSSRFRTLYIMHSADHIFTIRTMVENLMLSGQIPPMITVLTGYENPQSAVADIDRRYRTRKDPGERYLAGWSGETGRMVPDSRIWSRYIVIAPMDSPVMDDPDMKNLRMYVYYGRYDLPVVRETVQNLKKLKTDYLTIHTYPGGHHKEEWMRSLKNGVIKILDSDY